MLTKKLSVAGIAHGSVIDHVPAGYGLRILQLLRLNDHRKTVTVGFNLPSERLGLKDLIKVEGRILSASEIDQIAVLAPGATINLIRDYTVAEKFVVQLPGEIGKIFACPNDRCITNHEEVETRFTVSKLGRLIQLECRHCRKHFPRTAL